MKVLVAVALLLAGVSAAEELTSAKLVKDCQPCSFKPGKELPEYSFFFEQKAGERAVSAIRVQKGYAAAGRLEVKEMTPLGRSEQFFFGPQDVDCDGYRDLLLVTSKGAANAYAEYWRFEPKAGEYVALGKYPVFKVDQSRCVLSSYERGGYGGLVYEAKEYKVVDGKVTLMRSEKQELAKAPDVFRRTVSERSGKTLKVTSQQTLKGDAAKASY
jgi:hypothetical protein